jgi:FAD:protein FMN transferase
VADWRRMQPWLGTFVEIRVHGGDESLLVSAVNDAFAAIARTHAAMSFHDPASDLGRIHAAPPGTAITVDPWTHTVLCEALDLAHYSQGIFDPTIAKTLVADGVLPELTANSAEAHGSWHDILLEDANVVRCRRPLRLDLGGIAKGFAVDRAVDVLVAAGVDGGIVNAGGDLRVFGDQAMPIQVRHPAAAHQQAPLVSLSNEALATSAPTFSRVRRGRRWISALRDGRNGHSHLRPISVSVRAANCCHADGLTKVMLADRDIGTQMLQRYNAHAFIVDGETAPAHLPRHLHTHSNLNGALA